MSIDESKLYAAMHAYLPPDGIGKDEFITRVIEALDPPAQAEASTLPGEVPETMTIKLNITEQEARDMTRVARWERDSMEALEAATTDDTLPGEVDELATLEAWEHDDQRELSLLYNHRFDDSPQFNRGQMRCAIRHGRRIALAGIATPPTTPAVESGDGMLRELHVAMAEVMELRRSSSSLWEREKAEAAIAVWRKVEAFLSRPAVESESGERGVECAKLAAALAEIAGMGYAGAPDIAMRRIARAALSNFGGSPAINGETT